MQKNQTSCFRCAPCYHVMSESPLNLSCTKNASKLATIIQRILEMPCVPQKWKWAAARTIQLVQKLDKLKNLSKPNASHQEFFWWKWRKYGRNSGNYERLRKSLQERARLNTISWDFPRTEIIWGVLNMPCTSQKQKWAAARTTQLAQKLGKVFKNL